VNATALECILIDCAHSKILSCFPIWSGWITKHMENVLLYRNKSYAGPNYEVLTEVLGIASVHHCARDYSRYDCYHRDNETHRTEIEHSWDTLESLGIKIGHSLFHRLPQISPPALHKLDMLHTLYLALFQYMMYWILGFHKKHA